MMLTQRKLIYIGAGALVGILLLMLAFRTVAQFGTLQITAPKSTAGNAEVSIEVFSPDKDEAIETFKLKPGASRSMRVHVGNYQVNGSVGNVKAVDVANVKASSTTTLETPAGEQRAIKQLATNADCPAVFAGALFSYSCKGAEGAVIRHGNALGAGDAYLYDAQRFSNLQPITSGLLGFYSGTRPTELQYIQPQTEAIARVTLPGAIQKLLDKEQPNIITQPNSTDRFTLVFAKQNRIFMFQNLTDKNPKEIQLANGLKLTDPNRRYSITSDTDRLIIYAGIATNSGEGDVDGTVEEQPTGLPLYVTEYGTDGQQFRSTELGKEATGDSFHRITGDYYTLEHAYGVDFLHYEKGKFKTVYALPDVAGWASRNNTLYIQSGGTLYQFTPKENGSFGLHSRFTANDFRVSGLYSAPQGIVFTAFSGNSDDAPLNVYQLLDTPQVGNAPAVIKQPSFSGLEPLLEYGLTDDQISNLKAAFATYADKEGLALDTVAAVNGASVWRDPQSDATADVITFDAIINRGKTYKAKVEYSDLRSVRLYLNDASNGAQVFDSAAN